MNPRLDRGKAAFDQVYGDGAADRFLARRSGLGEDLARFGLEFNFADINARPGIDLATRELLTLATLIGMGGAEPQLKGHTRAALRLGVPPVKLAEVVLHTVQYVGFPRAINAMAVVRETLAECGVDVSQADPKIPEVDLQPWRLSHSSGPWTPRATTSPSSPPGCARPAPR